MSTTPTDHVARRKLFIRLLFTIPVSGPFTLVYPGPPCGLRPCPPPLPLHTFHSSPPTLIERESSGNPKRTCVTNGLARDWAANGEGREFLARATDVKTVWVPYGE